MPDLFSTSVDCYDADLAAPNTLTVTHIFDGEEVVTGGADGQIWIATFATRLAADAFVRWCQEFEKTYAGRRRETPLDVH
jgi:hypothetical protein